MSARRLSRFLLIITIFATIFFSLDQKIKSTIKIPEIVNPYQKLKDDLFLKEQMGEYGEKAIIKINANYYVKSHPSNSPGFFYEIFNHLPPKENEEIRIIFFGNSQIFYVPSGNRIPLPFKVETLLREKVKTQKISVLNLSCFGMNTSETLLTVTKSVLELAPDIIILPITPRDFANEEVKAMGLASEYSPPVLEPLVIKKLLAQHSALLKTGGLDLLLESLAQFSRVWQREFNQVINRSLAKIWPTYIARGILSEKVKQFLFSKTQVSSALTKVEAAKVKSPSLEQPLYSQESYPNVRSAQFKILLNFLSQNLSMVLVYNEPLRPKTINLYFTSDDYQKKVGFIKETSQKNGFYFIDFNNFLTDDYFEDWVHLNPKGVDKMATSLSNWVYQRISNKYQNGL